MRKEHIYNIGEIVNNSLIIVEKGRCKKRKNAKSYIVQSLKYPKAPPYKVYESHLKNGHGCAYSSKPCKRVFEGNSLWSLKWARPYIVDIEYAKTIPPHKNSVKIDFKCPDCNRVKKMTPTAFVSCEGMACSFCSSNKYYPELFFEAYNEVKNTGFLPQQSFKEFKNHIFDFVNPDTMTIIETHGSQHYDKECNWYERTHKSDTRKRKWAKDNNYNLIELDCSKSEFNYILNSINKCTALPNINKEEERKILKKIQENKRYPVQEIIHLYTNNSLTTTKISEIYGYTPGVIINILKKNNIEIKGNKKKLPEKEIIKLYTVENMSSIKISQKYGVGKTAILNLLKRNNIVIKNPGSYKSK